MRVLRWLVVVMAGLYLLTGLVQVRRGERAVIRRLGRVLPDQPEPGLHIGLPWGLDRVDLVEVDTVRSIEVGYRTDRDTSDSIMPAGQLLTGDHNLVNMQVVLNYKVRPEQVVDFVLAARRVPELIERGVESAMATWVAGRDIDEVLLRGKNALRRELIPQVQAMLEPYRLGIEVVDVRVARVAPPDEVRDAFDSVSRAQTQIATLQNRAQLEAETRVRLARAEAYRIEQAALGYGHARRVIARQEARRFTERVRQYHALRDRNPDFLRQIWQEERGRLFLKMKESGLIDLLDHHLSSGGLDILSAPRLPGR
ncbi:MAG: protease modulator HflK [Gemmataceae bacterium]